MSLELFACFLYLRYSLEIFTELFKKTHEIRLSNLEKRAIFLFFKKRVKWCNLMTKIINRRKQRGGYKKTSNESQKMKAANVSFFGLDERVKIKYENSG